MLVKTWITETKTDRLIFLDLVLISRIFFLSLTAIPGYFYMYFYTIAHFLPSFQFLLPTRTPSIFFWLVSSSISSYSALKLTTRHSTPCKHWHHSELPFTLARNKWYLNSVAMHFIKAPSFWFDLATSVKRYSICFFDFVLLCWWNLKMLCLNDENEKL